MISFTLLLPDGGSDAFIAPVDLNTIFNLSNQLFFNNAIFLLLHKLSSYDIFIKYVKTRIEMFNKIAMILVGKMFECFCHDTKLDEI